MNSKKAAAFTLLELVVVLAILAVVTAMATRSLSNLDDQRKFDASQRGLDELQTAVIGSDDDRAPDGTRIISGFVADMGRLPQTVLDPDNPQQFTLRELWFNPSASFDVRLAVVTNGIGGDDQDPQVLVPGGWRGPYLRLPLGATNLLDGWGNGYSSPAIAPSADTADTTGYARLRDASDGAITAFGQPIVVVRHLGADGRLDSSDSIGYDRDQFITFTNDKIHATLTGSVEVLDGDHPAVPDSNKKVIVRVFAPSPANPAQIIVYKTFPAIDFGANPVNYTITAPELTIGARIVRAYLMPDSSSIATTAATGRSGVKTVVLRAGVNVQNLTIDR